MEVSTEAKRIMVVALGKLYGSRTQRGGLRLHRSLLLTLVMKSARDVYHAAQAAESDPSEQQRPEAQTPTDSEPSPEPQGPASLATGKPRTLAAEEEEEEAAAAGSPAEPRLDAHRRAGDVESACPTAPAQPSRKRRGKAAVEPDFLPCKKAKLEQKRPVKPVLVDYVSCGSGLGAPVSLHRAIAAC